MPSDMWLSRYGLLANFNAYIISRRDDILSRSDDLISRSDDIITRRDDIKTRRNDILSRHDDKLSRSNDLISRSDDIITRSDDLISRSDDIISRGNELSNKISIPGFRRKWIIYEHVESIPRTIKYLRARYEIREHEFQKRCSNKYFEYF